MSVPSDTSAHSEPPYAFRRRLAVVHQPHRRDPQARPEPDETALGEGWSIAVSPGASPLVLEVAKDLQDYFLVSMGESLPLRRLPALREALEGGQRVIVLATREELPHLAPEEGSAPRSYRVSVTPSSVVVCGQDERGVGQGSYYLEDLLNLRGAPLLRAQDVTRRPLFSPRMVHSGWGLDQFPDGHLNAIAHAGMDAILLFVTGVDRTPDEHTHEHRHPGAGRYQDVNDLVDRATRYGIDVYFYAYFRSLDALHPDHPDAEAFYEGTFGAVFRACPRARGIILVGESVEFPSKDPATTGRNRLAPSPDGLPATKPSPGWWPCRDYPQWLSLVQRVVRRHNPQADVVFWTYNWGYAPEEPRLALLRALPADATLQVTFEMFEPLEREELTTVCVDYTISFEGPGRYFASEARVAHERGLRLYAMANTAGLTWDVGVIPYEPVPYQWARRHAALRRAREEWGLCGLMESHHFGWWPSPISELAKGAYWEPAPPAEERIGAMARRDFGPQGAPEALLAWQRWSEAIRDYVPTNEDQYGPFRIGPAYPLIFQAPAPIPVASHAMFGARIVRTPYRPLAGRRQPAGATRIEAEIRRLEGMARRWEDGVGHMERAVSLAPQRLQTDAARQLGVGRFVLHAVRTTINVKRWWRLTHAVLGEADPARARALLDEMETLALEEIANAEATVPLVAADSRLGWEPSMDYMCDPPHLAWKIAQVRRVLEQELPAYRAALDRAPPAGPSGP